MEGCWILFLFLFAGGIGVSIVASYVITLIFRKIYSLIPDDYTENKQQAKKGQVANGNMLKGKSPNQLSLIRYIYLAKQDAYSDEKIVSILKSKNWAEDEIKEAFDSLN